MNELWSDVFEVKEIFITERKFPDADKKRLRKKKFKFIFRTKSERKLQKSFHGVFLQPE